MRVLLLLLIPLLAYSGEAEFKKHLEDAKAIIHAVYLSDDAEAYCRENPGAVYIVNIEGYEIEFPCKQRNAWVDKVAKK